MRKRLKTISILLIAGCLFALNAHAQEASSAVNDQLIARHTAAIQRAEANLRPDNPVGLASRYATLGDAQLRAGKCQESVASFERAIELDPNIRPYLWQHGIALFFVGRFTEGRDLFVEHRRVNPNDVENAAWHFLCEAKANGIESARKLLLPAPGDRRAPMSQILDRLPGGDAAAIESAVDAIASPTGKQSARFYADLYLGLIADAEGDSASARRFMTRAGRAPLNHYMADVARVYADQLGDG